MTITLVISPLISFITFCLTVTILVEIRYICNEVKSVSSYIITDKERLQYDKKLTCDNDWIGINGKCYYYPNIANNWNDSVINCRSKSSVLYLQNYADKVSEFVKIIADNEDIWLGSVTDQGCLYMNTRGSVKSDECHKNKKYICEKPTRLQ